MEKEKIIMYELIQAGPRTYYIHSPAKIGIVILSENNVCLIDSGNDKDAGKKVKKILEQHNWKLVAIYNTHSHADHIGGNAYLQKQTNCDIFAPSMEVPWIQYPILEPAFLYGGFPRKDLCHKFLMATPSNVQPLTPANLPKHMEVISLPGHSYEMVGYRTPDNVIFLADCVSSKTTLEKYQMSYLYHVKDYLDTLHKIKDLKASLFIPSHAEVTTCIDSLAELNEEKVFEIIEVISDICSVPSSFEQILASIFSRYDLMINHEQHALLGSTTRSYLSYMVDQGILSCEFQNKIQVFVAKPQ